MLGHDAPPPSRASRVLLLILIFAPVIFFEYLVYFGVIPYIYRQYFLVVYAAGAFVGLAALMLGRKVSVFARKAETIIPVIRMLLLLVGAGAITMCNERFLPELSGKPFSFAEQAKLIDKAVLSAKLFGSGKTHHLLWAGTYPYYVEGTMIDALGKCDKAIARFPVDEAVAWNGIRGMPGHAKYDFRETILRRKPDIIVDYTGWGKQDLSKEIQNSYSLIKPDGVSLRVKRELTAGLENLVSGSCPRQLL